MQLFYAPEFTPPAHTLNEEESKHCIRVLRLGCGDTVHLTDGRGNLYLCRITDDNPRRCSVEAIETQHEYGKLPYRLTMAVAPTKNIDRFEWFLEKATEVGVSEIIPLNTAHSERHTLKLDREQKVITAAIKQSLKAYHPILQDLTPIKKVLDTPFPGRKFIAHCAAPLAVAQKRHLANALQPGEAALILIGPEGDFSTDEIARAVEAGFEQITLGEQRLRTETAAVAAVVTVAVVNAQKSEN